MRSDGPYQKVIEKVYPHHVEYGQSGSSTHGSTLWYLIPSKRKTPSSSSAPARSSRAKTTAQCSVSIGVPTVDGQGVAESKIGKRLLRNGVADLPRVPSTRYIPCFVENPGNSRMWDVPCASKLFKLEGVFFTKSMLVCTVEIVTS